MVVVDTDVVSYFFRGDTRAAMYRPHVEGRLAVIAAQTRAELERWALQYQWGRRRRLQMLLRLRRFVLAPFDEQLCVRWAEVTDGGRRRGRPITCADAWVAATALRLDLPLVTHNRAHFADVEGLTVISEA